jgi:hypothetical protein
MKKRTYGTGTLTQIPSGKWLLQYKPKWATTRQSKTIDTCKEKPAEKQLSDWVAELDEQAGPKVKVSIDALIALHVADMRLNNCSPENIAITERRAQKHLGEFSRRTTLLRRLRRAISNSTRWYARIRPRSPQSTANSPSCTAAWSWVTTMS